MLCLEMLISFENVDSIQFSVWKIKIFKSEFESNPPMFLKMVNDKYLRMTSLTLSFKVILKFFNEFIIKIYNLK